MSTSQRCSVFDFISCIILLHFIIKLLIVYRDTCARHEIWICKVWIYASFQIKENKERGVRKLFISHVRNAIMSSRPQRRLRRCRSTKTSTRRTSIKTGDDCERPRLCLHSQFRSAKDLSCGMSQCHSVKGSSRSVNFVWPSRKNGIIVDPIMNQLA